MGDRYARQRLLAEVGDDGQARIEAARLGVAASPEAWTEATYLARAGVHEIAPASGPPLPFAHATVFRHEGPRRDAAGAWRALRQLRHVLEGGP